MILQLGSKGEEVKELQEDLKSLGFYNGEIDGDFGPKTLESVKSFQLKNIMLIDGIVGPKTLNKIAEKLNKPVTNKTILLDTIAGINIYKDKDFIYFVGGMAIDVDGSPRAYHKNNSLALDYLENAGHPGNWWGISVDSNGKPYVQKETDPFPGYYVSTTSLEDFKYPKSDPRRYFNSEEKAGYVLPPKALKVWGLKLGQKAIITNKSNGKSTEAVLFDIGPSNKISEASMKTAELLGINNNPKNGGTEKKIIEYKIIL